MAKLKKQTYRDLDRDPVDGGRSDRPHESRRRRSVQEKPRSGTRATRSPSGCGLERSSYDEGDGPADDNDDLVDDDNDDDDLDDEMGEGDHAYRKLVRTGARVAKCEGLSPEQGLLRVYEDPKYSDLVAATKHPVVRVEKSAQDAFCGAVMLAVGDAAFAHNPLAGRGLSFALGSALAAAATVASWRNRPRACADAAEYYREYVDAERRRHLAFLASFDNRPPPIRLIGSSHVLSWQAPVAMTPLALGECIRRAPAIRLNDGGFVRWLGDFDLLQLRALCAVSARPDALIARLCALGLGGREAVLLLHWAVQNGVLAETEAERGGRLASPI